MTSKDPTPEKIVKLGCGAKKQNEKVNYEWVKECNEFIDKHLRVEVGRSQGLLLPDKDFYYNANGDINDLTTMANKIIRWLGLEVERDELRINFDDTIEAPALFYQQANRSHILINSKYNF